MKSIKKMTKKLIKTFLLISMLVFPLISIMINAASNPIIDTQTNSAQTNDGKVKIYGTIYYIDKPVKNMTKYELYDPKRDITYRGYTGSYESNNPGGFFEEITLEKDDTIIFRLYRNDRIIEKSVKFGIDSKLIKMDIKINSDLSRPFAYILLFLVAGLTMFLYWKFKKNDNLQKPDENKDTKITMENTKNENKTD